MRQIVIAFVLIGGMVSTSNGQTISSFFPEDMNIDSAIPQPTSIQGYYPGKRHIRHDQLIRYLETLADASPRAKLEITGFTHEQRPLVLLAISSAENIAKLDEIRNNRSLNNGPLVIWLGYSVHGNEASGSNTAPLISWLLAASQEPEMLTILDNTVILIDPSLNPDGLARFSQWTNSHKGYTAVTDPKSREHLEPWPNGRTNHYWFDLNRDWLLLQQPESKARMIQYQKWRPHVLTDFHEMGSNSTYFFQPGIPSRRNPLTPKLNEDLTRTIAGYHAAAFDTHGQLYYSEESFDDYYFGKGSTYPDINGGIGILFEQASSRGNVISTDNGPLSLEDTIRNQLITSISTIRASWDQRQEIIDYQSQFYKNARAESKQDPIKAFVIDIDDDPVRAQAFVDILTQHDIRVHKLQRSIVQNDHAFNKDTSLIIPNEQRQYRLLKSIMETRTSFSDPSFYDVSTWTLPLAFDLPFAAVRNLRNLVGETVDSIVDVNSIAPAKAYAWLFQWNQYFAPKALQRLLNEHIAVRVAEKPFSIETDQGLVDFKRGTIIIPRGLNNANLDTLSRLLKEIALQDFVPIYSVQTGLSQKGVDLGSPSIRPIEPIKPLLITGHDVNTYEAGEVWHLLDTRVGLGLSMVDIQRFHEINLRKYTHLILVDGNYKKFSSKAVSKIKSWIKMGGQLIASKKATQWVESHLIKSKPNDIPANKDVDKADDEKAISIHYSYADYEKLTAEKLTSGSIFQLDIDTSHPLFYGYQRPHLAVFRNNTRLLVAHDNPFVTPARYAQSPLLSGFINDKRLEQLEGTPAVIALRSGKGSIIRFSNDLNFRGYWYGTNKLFLNALFFSKLIKKTTWKPIKTE